MTPPTLRSLFPLGTFQPPATESQIAAVEATLGVRLPEQLRRLYFECDGFIEDLTASRYLHRLSTEPSGDSLLAGTQFFWKPVEGWPDLRPFIFFGRTGGDDNWGINWKKARRDHRLPPSHDG